MAPRPARPINVSPLGRRCKWWGHPSRSTGSSLVPIPKEQQGLLRSLGARDKGALRATAASRIIPLSLVDSIKRGPRVLILSALMINNRVFTTNRLNWKLLKTILKDQKMAPRRNSWDSKIFTKIWSQVKLLRGWVVREARESNTLNSNMESALLIRI